MTFCLAFSASPDGIAVISDTRITRADCLHDDSFQKTFFPTNNSFIAVAGSVGTLMDLLRHVSGVLSVVVPDSRTDCLRATLQARFKALTANPPAKGPQESASIIYGDVRLGKGPAGCRLLRFDMGWNEAGTPFFIEQSGATFAHQQALKFPGEDAAALPWLCIGAAEGSRNFVGNTTMDHVRQLLPRGLRIDETVDSRQLAASSRVYQQVNVRGATQAGANAAIVMDMTGPENGSFRRELRRFAKEHEKRGAPAVIDVIYVLGMAALKRTADMVEEATGILGPGVSNTWSLATISPRHGIKLLTGEDAAGVMMNFALNTGL